MSETSSGFGSGILRGLKKILFTDDTAAQPGTPPVANAPVANPPGTNAAPPTGSPVAAAPHPQAPVANAWPSPDGSNKEMKLKVYQLLENMNQPGIDFFEVWNASTEMGGASSATIKAAFTSLKFADKTLTKTKLLETGEFYKTNLQKVIDTETQKRQDEKDGLNKEKEQLASSLSAEITGIEQQIQALQDKLAAKKNERNTINEKYEPRIIDIDSRIQVGKQTVSEVVGEMQQVLDIIQREIS